MLLDSYLLHATTFSSTLVCDVDSISVTTRAEHKLS